VSVDWIQQGASLSSDDDLRQLQLRGLRHELWMRWLVLGGALLLPTAGMAALFVAPGHGPLPKIGVSAILAVPLYYFFGSRGRPRRSKRQSTGGQLQSSPPEKVAGLPPSREDGPSFEMPAPAGRRGQAVQSKVPRAPPVPRDCSGSVLDSDATPEPGSGNNRPGDRVDPVRTHGAPL
jgi:hypothetical protein